MQTQFKAVVSTFAVPLLFCVACPPPIAVPGPYTDGPESTLPGGDESSLPTTGVDPEGSPTETTGPATDDTGDTEGPREPIANSVLARFVDDQGNKVPGAWVRVLATPDDPPPPPTPEPEPEPIPALPPGMGTRIMDPELPPPLTADSDGNVLVEALGSGEQRWMIGAPGFVTRTEVFNLAAGTRTSSKFRLKRKGQTFAFDTVKAQAFEHENVSVELPAGHMINRRTGEQVTGPVSVTLTVVNPVEGDLDAPPVPLIGVDTEGGSGSLVSFGMVGVELTDADGDRLELNEEVTAKVSFKLTAEQSAQVDLLGATIIPAWHADPDIGETEWKEVGVFYLSEKDDQGRYTVTTHAIQRFSWINTDLKSDQPRCYVIKVVDEQDQPVIGQQVQIGPYVGFTDDGTVCIDFGLGKPPVDVFVADLPKQVINVEVNQPKSVCAQNNRPWYINETHGQCTELKFVLNDSPTCVPGSTWDCSDEPNMDSDPALDGVGICKSAYRLCADGTGWGQCIPPVKPKPEVCDDPNLGLDEDCDGSTNEQENGNGCNCSPSSQQYCYVGNKDDLDVANTACTPGLQKCAPNSEWGTCMTDLDGLGLDAEMITPSFIDEDCDPGDGIESCTAKPCDFDPLWWHSFGGKAKNVNLSSYLNGNFMTAVTHMTIGGNTKSYGNCFDGNSPFNKANFKGVTLAHYHTINTDPQECGDPNIIEGNLKPDTIHADSGSTGSAVSGVTGGAVLTSLKGTSNGCGMGIPGGTAFVTRFNSKNVCQFRVVADAAVTIKDVAVGNTTGSTYVGLTLTGDQVVNLSAGGVALPDCSFASVGQHSAYVKLGLDQNFAVTCKKVEYPAETVQAIDVDSTGALSAVYRMGAMGEQIRLRQLNSDLAPAWPSTPDQVAASQAATLAVGADFEPFDIAANGQKIAVTGNFRGSMSSYTQQLESPDNDYDFVLLVADNLIVPQRGVTLQGRGDPNKGDKGDFGTAVAWVTYIDPVTYVATDGLVVAGNSYSEDFWFGSCWTDVNQFYDPQAQALDSFVGVFKYSSGMVLDGDACADHHVLTGFGDQGVASLTVGNMRLGVCGHHTDAINIGGKIVEPYINMDNDKNAHCGVTVLPVKPIQ